jgi:hypothetical protein
MTRLLFLLLLMALLPSPAFAEGNAKQTLAELRANGAIPLSKNDLQTFLPGTKLIHLSDTGITRRWENSPNGVFVAVAESRQSWASARFANGHGKWHIGDNGTYCVSIEWTRQTEQWCRFVLRQGDKYYGVASLDDPEVKAFEFSLSK